MRTLSPSFVDRERDKHNANERCFHGGIRPSFCPQRSDPSMRTATVLYCMKYLVEIDFKVLSIIHDASTVQYSTVQ